MLLHASVASVHRFAESASRSRRVGGKHAHSQMLVHLTCSTRMKAVHATNCMNEIAAGAGMEWTHLQAWCVTKGCGCNVEQIDQTPSNFTLLRLHAAAQ